MLLPVPIQNLINAFSRLPGIGPKSASRLTFFLLRAPDELSSELSEAVRELKVSTSYCPTCFNIMAAGLIECEICASPDRDPALICVVEEPMDVWAIERTEAYAGKYHVLGGVLSPVEGITPDKLNINPLLDRVQTGNVREVIVATNPTMEGESTVTYLRLRLQPFGVRITHLARGLPFGGDLEYTDPTTLLRALAGRQEIG